MQQEVLWRVKRVVCRDGPFEVSTGDWMIPLNHISSRYKATDVRLYMEALFDVCCLPNYASFGCSLTIMHCMTSC